MEKYIPTVNGKTLKDDGVYSQNRSNVITPEEDWTSEIRKNVITHLPISLDKSLYEELIHLAKNVTYKTYYDLNLYDIENNLKNRLTNLFQAFDEINSFSILKLPKKTNIWPHTDPNRHVNIYVPLYPSGQDYSPLEIYYNDKIYGVANNTYKTYVWNTQKLHCVINNSEHDRYNLQASIYIPYTEFYEKYKDLIDV